MRKLALSIACAAALLASVGSAEAGKQYRAYFGCGESAGPSDFCVIGSGWGVTFEAKDGNRTRYRLCVKSSDGSKDCDQHKTNRRGQDFVPLFNQPNEMPGKYRATWKVGGDFAGRDKLILGPGD